MDFDLQSIEKNFKEKFSFFQSQFKQMDILTSYNTFVIDSGFKTDMFNLIYSTGRESRKDVRKSLDHFREKHFPYCWWQGFENEPDWLVESLKSEGLAAMEEEMVMAARLDKLIWPEEKEGLSVKRVDDKESLEDFLSVMKSIIPEEEIPAIEGFFKCVEPVLVKDHSSIEYFVGYANEKPVATCSVFYSNHIASIFDVVVSPSERGQGLGKLMTAAGMKKAAEKGFEVFALTATDDAKFLYEKIGFQKLKLMRVFSESIEIDG